MVSVEGKSEAIRLGIFLHHMYEQGTYHPMDAERFAKIQTVMNTLMEGVNVLPSESPQWDEEPQSYSKNEMFWILDETEVPWMVQERHCRFLQNASNSQLPIMKTVMNSLDKYEKVCQDFYDWTDSVKLDEYKDDRDILRNRCEALGCRSPIDFTIRYISNYHEKNLTWLEWILMMIFGAGRINDQGGWSKLDHYMRDVFPYTGDIRDLLLITLDRIRVIMLPTLKANQVIKIGNETWIIIDVELHDVKDTYMHNYMVKYYRLVKTTEQSVDVSKTFCQEHEQYLDCRNSIWSIISNKGLYWST